MRTLAASPNLTQTQRKGTYILKLMGYPFRSLRRRQYVGCAEGVSRCLPCVTMVRLDLNNHTVIIGQNRQTPSAPLHASRFAIPPPNAARISICGVTRSGRSAATWALAGAYDPVGQGWMPPSGRADRPPTERHSARKNRPAGEPKADRHKAWLEQAAEQGVDPAAAVKSGRRSVDNKTGLALDTCCFGGLLADSRKLARLPAMPAKALLFPVSGWRHRFDPPALRLERRIGGRR